MEKYDYISELAENTAFEIVQNQEEWKKYLTTAARLYKYPFREQLLINASHPEYNTLKCESEANNQQTAERGNNDAKEADLAIIPAEYSHKKAVKKKPKLL